MTENRCIKNRLFSGDSEDNFASSPSDRLTPPSSPRLIKEKADLGSNYDPVDLQLDYWAVVSAAAEFGNVSSSGKFEQTSCQVDLNYGNNKSNSINSTQP